MCGSLQATLECEPPNANLHKFQGRLMYTSEGEGGPCVMVHAGVN